jgi:hypothetical protein
MASSNKIVDNIIASIEALPQARILSLYRGNRKILGWFPKDAIRGMGSKTHIQEIKEVLCSEFQQRGTYQIRYKTSPAEKEYEYHEYQKVIGQINGEAAMMPINPTVVASEYAVKDISDVLVEIQVLKIRSEYAERDLAAAKAELKTALDQIDKLQSEIEDLEDAKELADQNAKPGFLADVMANPEKIAPLLETLAPILQNGFSILGQLMQGKQQTQQPAQQEAQPIAQQQMQPVMYQMQPNGQIPEPQHGQN